MIDKATPRGSVANYTGQKQSVLPLVIREVFACHARYKTDHVFPFPLARTVVKRFSVEIVNPAETL